ncbi:PP2C family protein-serine/threonine phosphatase [Frankia nepalensis]|uniref:SpoIIE family protein phosphatase n=2 Tax=Frankia nepalensis TaxID=1836974 RepID=A0A937RMM3_9ACTN|nr:GAF domain-containing SpoIIE family protein phosphatase [Frankia nepalensis]MBL7495615.1 SpoIIE family protein phosphatase [Frankia nepalensis]MBL7508861.1 SpoIIE family protein phosphatase [Frankia nepalensis]MBL7630084.1 SpoIIE family protein phosphatase [Frankia nepalensis]
MPPAPVLDEDRPFERLTALARIVLAVPVAFVAPAGESGAGLPDAPRGPSWASDLAPDTLAHALREILAGGAPLTVNNVQTDPSTRDDPRLGATGVAAWTCAGVDGPAGETLALFCVLDTAARRWTEHDLEILGGLARVAAGELGWREDTARAGRAAERLRAPTAQEPAPRMGLLLPRTSGVPGMQVAARGLPAVDGLRALGDFYDVFPVWSRGGTASRPCADRVHVRRESKADRWDVVIGDVSGHGPEAAVVAALARRMIRAVAMTEKTPAGVLDRLNTALLARSLGSERFLTATYVMLFPDPGGVRALLASAGHMPALLRTSAGSVRAIGYHGLPLGLFDESGLKNVRVLLRPGDTLLLYTDGVTEARQGREQYGEERLRALLAAVGQLSAHDLVDAVEEDVLAFAGGSHADDIAVLALRSTDVADQIRQDCPAPPVGSTSG